MQLISTLALATSAAALVAPAAPKASTKLDVATLKNPSSTEFAYGLPGNEIPGVPNSRFDFDPLGFAERASPAEMVKYREAELKHGRVAMLAITGMLFAEVWHPMLYAPSNVPAIFACGPSVLKVSRRWRGVDARTRRDLTLLHTQVPGHASAVLHSRSCALSYWCGRDGVVPWMGAD